MNNRNELVILSRKKHMKRTQESPCLNQAKELNKKQGAISFPAMMKPENKAPILKWKRTI